MVPVVEDLRDFMVEHKLSQGFVADKLGVSQPTVYYWLMRGSEPKYRYILAIKKLLKTNPNGKKKAKAA